jgi:hypothetical protein
LSALRSSSAELSQAVAATETDALHAGQVRKLFRALDQNRNGTLSNKEIELFEHHFGHVASAGTSSEYMHGNVSVRQFADLCKIAVDRHGAAKFEQMTMGLVETQLSLDYERTMYWHTFANRIDESSRIIFFLGYSFVLLVLYMWDPKPKAPQRHVNFDL